MFNESEIDELVSNNALQTINENFRENEIVNKKIQKSGIELFEEDLDDRLLISILNETGLI